MCDKVAFPCCGVPFSNHDIFKKKCCFEECTHCQAFANRSACLLNCPSLFDATKQYVWKAYTDVIRDNYTTGIELRERTGTGVDIRKELLDQLTKYKEHYFKYRWLHFCRKHDIRNNASSSTMYMQSDYSAQPNLQSQDKLNCEPDGVCCLSCWVVLHSPKQMTFTTEDNEAIAFTFFEVDHIRAVSPSSGKCKDQDWFLHTTIFKFLVEKYRDEIPDFNRVILWTDGAPNQYKCRQNFLWVAKALDQLGIQVIHRFGATAQFKGVHDKVGQIAKWVVKLKERLGVLRVSTAFEFYMAVKEHLMFNKTFPSIGEKYRKGQFEATRYELYYVASSVEDAEHKPADDVHMVLDRSKMWDSNAAETSSRCHEFVGFGGAGDNLALRFLPCPCEHCCMPGAHMGNYASCINKHIVGDVRTVRIDEKYGEASLDMLQEPLTQYTVAALKLFLKSKINKLPRMLRVRKQDYIIIIRIHLSELISPAPVGHNLP